MEHSFLVRGTLKSVLQLLPAQDFCQIHLSFVVHFRHVASFDHSKVYGPNWEASIGE